MGTHQTVIQALGRFFRNIGVVSGSTVMGDGRVALILEVAGMVLWPIAILKTARRPQRKSRLSSNVAPGRKSGDCRIGLAFADHETIPAPTGRGYRRTTSFSVLQTGGCFRAAKTRAFTLMAFHLYLHTARVHISSSPRW